MDPLQIAVAYQQFECVKLLLRAGANAQSSTREAAPLYHVAVKQRCAVEFLQLLYEFGVSVYTRDNHGKFPWQYDLSGYPEEERHRVLQYFCTIRGKHSTHIFFLQKMNYSQWIYRWQSLGRSGLFVCSGGTGAQVNWGAARVTSVRHVRMSGQLIKVHIPCVFQHQSLSHMLY